MDKIRVTRIEKSELSLRLSKLIGPKLAREVMDRAHRTGAFSYEGKFAICYDQAKSEYIAIGNNSGTYRDLTRPVKTGL